LVRQNRLYPIFTMVPGYGCKVPQFLASSAQAPHKGARPL